MRIVPQNGKLWAEYVYKTQSFKASSLDYSHAIGIDHGVTNWLTVVSTQGKSFIVNGRKVKSINQRYNRFVAKQKQLINIGKTNNQNFVQIPTARLKNRIKQLAESVGIIFTETEEAYSSKASFLDNDLVPRHGEKPSEYKFSGKRIKRGLYQTALGWLINSDLNGAANCLKKVAHS